MATPTKLPTVEEYRKLPEPGDGCYYELHHGEVVKVTRPKLKHSKIQRQVVHLLEPLVANFGVVWDELAFRPLEHEVWSADVGIVSAERWRGADNDDNLNGAPDVVIEVLSPSNTASEMDEREALCLRTGSREFWVIDPKRPTVKVVGHDGVTHRYDRNATIPLPMFGDASIRVADIFNI